MSTRCLRKPWLSHVIGSFRLYTTVPRSDFEESILQHVKKKYLSQAHAMIKKKDPPPSVTCYGFLLKAYAKQIPKKNVLEKSIGILEEMKIRGLEPNSQNYMQLIIGLGLKSTPLVNQEKKWMQIWFEEFIRIESNNRFPKKLFEKYKKLMYCCYQKQLPKNKENFYAVLDAFKHVELRDRETWNLVITSCIRSNKLKDAEEVLDRARQMKVSNATSFHIMIKAYLNRNDPSSAHRMFKSLLTDNVAADRKIYETFINYYLTKKGDKIVDMLKRLWQGVLLTTKENEPVDPYLIRSLTYYYRHHNALAEAEQLFLDLKVRKEPMEPEYLLEVNSVITQFVDKRQYPSAVSMYYDLVGLGHMPPSETLQHIVSGLKKDQNIESVDQVMKALIESGDSLEVLEQLLKVLPSANIEH